MIKGVKLGVFRGGGLVAYSLRAFLLKVVLIEEVVTRCDHLKFTYLRGSMGQLKQTRATPEEALN